MTLIAVNAFLNSYYFNVSHSSSVVMVVLCGSILTPSGENWKQSISFSTHLRFSFRHLSMLACSADGSHMFVIGSYWKNNWALVLLWKPPVSCLIYPLRHPEGEKAAKCDLFDGVAHTCMIMQDEWEQGRMEMMSSNKASDAAGVLLTLEHYWQVACGLFWIHYGH